MMEAAFDGNVSGCPRENVEAFPLFYRIQQCPATQVEWSGLLHMYV